MVRVVICDGEGGEKKEKASLCFEFGQGLNEEGVEELKRDNRFRWLDMKKVAFGLEGDEHEFCVNVFVGIV